MSDLPKSTQLGLRWRRHAGLRVRHWRASPCQLPRLGWEGIFSARRMLAASDTRSSLSRLTYGSRASTPRPHAAGAGAPGNSSVGSFELLGNINGVLFMGVAEIHVGPFSLLGDVLHVPVESNITTPQYLLPGWQGGADDEYGRSAPALPGTWHAQPFGMPARLSLMGVLDESEPSDRRIITAWR
jgi:hypothetical protein